MPVTTRRMAAAAVAAAAAEATRRAQGAAAPLVAYDTPEFLASLIMAGVPPVTTHKALHRAVVWSACTGHTRHMHTWMQQQYWPQVAPSATLAALLAEQEAVFAMCIADHPEYLTQALELNTQWNRDAFLQGGSTTQRRMVGNE